MSLPKFQYEADPTQSLLYGGTKKTQAGGGGLGGNDLPLGGAKTSRPYSGQSLDPNATLTAGQSMVNSPGMVNGPGRPKTTAPQTQTQPSQLPTTPQSPTYKGSGTPITSPAQTPAPAPAPTAPASEGGATGGNVADQPRPGSNNGLGGMSRDQLVDHFFSQVDSTKSKDQWGAWVDEFGVGSGPGQIDPTCPPTKAFHTSKNVSGGDAGACVDHPDACPPGTSAWGRDQCQPEGYGQGQPATPAAAPPKVNAVTAAPAQPAVPYRIYQPLASTASLNL